MQHRKLDALMSSIEKIARVAAAGVEQARAVQTEPSGAKSYDNADGTRTIIGNIANGESNPSFTMATHVGDVTAPGTPTGITASSKSGVVVVEWDGTLSGGIPDDFFCVRIFLDGAELGVLREAGSVSSAKLESGTTHSVTATAEDDACLPDGTPAHNVSAPTAAVSVTVSEGVESVAAIAQQALDVANAVGQHFWPDTDGIHVTEVTEEEWKDSTGSSYHSGMNVLINALGQLFRNGLNSLLALTTGEDVDDSMTVSGSERNFLTLTERPLGTVAFQDPSGNDISQYVVYPWLGDVFLAGIDAGYCSQHSGEAVHALYSTSPAVSIFDGNGNSDSDIVATFTATVIELGRTAAQAVIEFCGGAADLSYRGTTAFLRSKDGSIAMQGGTGDLYAGTQAALAVTTLDEMYDGSTLVNLGSASPHIFAMANDVYLADSTDPYTQRYQADMLEVINSIRTASTTMQLTNVGSGTHTLNLYRQGHFVFASMSSAINPSSANTAINAGTVPSGYRPAAWAMCSGAGMVGNTINNWFYRWRVATTGAITLHISVTGAREAPLVMSWFTNDDWPV